MNESSGGTCQLCGLTIHRPSRLPVFSQLFYDVVGCHPGAEPVIFPKPDGSREVANTSGALEGLYISDVCVNCVARVQREIDAPCKPLLGDIAFGFQKTCTVFELELLARWSFKTALLASSAYPQPVSSEAKCEIQSLLSSFQVPKFVRLLGIGTREGEVTKVLFRSMSASDGDTGQPSLLAGISIIGLPHMTLATIFGRDSELLELSEAFWRNASNEISQQVLWPPPVEPPQLPLQPLTATNAVLRCFENYGEPTASWAHTDMKAEIRTDGRSSSQ